MAGPIGNHFAGARRDALPGQVDDRSRDLVIPPSTVPGLVHAVLTHDDSGKVASAVYGADNSCER